MIGILMMRKIPYHEVIFFSLYGYYKELSRGDYHKLFLCHKQGVDVGGGRGISHLGS